MTDATAFEGGADGRAQVYYAARQFGPQWRALILALVAELHANADAADAAAFLREVGARTARLLPIAKVPTLEELEVEMNRQLGAIDWGLVSLSVGEGRIIIRQQAAPLVVPEDSEGLWPRAFAAILEGFYRQWFLFQDSPAEFRVVTAAFPAFGAVEFHYGR